MVWTPFEIWTLSTIRNPDIFGFGFPLYSVKKLKKFPGNFIFLDFCILRWQNKSKSVVFYGNRKRKTLVASHLFRFYMRMGAEVSMASMPLPPWSCPYSMASDKVGTVPPDKWERRGTRRDMDLKKINFVKFNFGDLKSGRVRTLNVQLEVGLQMIRDFTWHLKYMLTL